MNYFEKDGVIKTKDNISTISLYDLDGTFDEAIANLKKEKEYYDNIVTNKILQTCYISPGKRIQVVYDRIYLDIGYSGDGDGERLRIMGERTVIGTELEEYNQKEQARKKENEEYQRKQYEALKQKFEKQ